MAEDAKKLRGTAKGLFTRARNSLLRAIDNDVDIDIVNRRFDDLKRKLDSLHEKHENVLFMISDDTVRAQEETWIEEIDQQFDSAELAQHHFIRSKSMINVIPDYDSNHKEEDQVKQRAFQVRKMEKSVFLKHIQNMEDMISKTSSTDMSEVLRVSQVELKEMFNACKKAHSKFLMSLSDAESSNELLWLDNLQDQMADINVKVASALKQAKTTRDDLKASNLRMERMKMPSFDGNIRDYPRFKADFLSQVTQNVTGDAAQAYALKSCLTNTPYDIVRNVDNDISEMWNRLDEKYGKTSKMIDVIMYEVKSHS